MTDNPNDQQKGETIIDQKRRKVLASAAGIAAAGAMGIYATESAKAAPSGTFPVSTDDPLLKIRADQIRFVPRSSDPSSPDGGTMWVVE